MPQMPLPHGPKKKTQVGVPSGGARNMRVPLLAGGSGIMLLIAVLGVLLLGAGGGNAKVEAPKLLEAAGCTFQTVKALKGVHSIATPEGTSRKWNTSPATNGPHYVVPAIWGAYTEPLLQAQVVHNLEHGGIFIQYGKAVPQATVDELTAFYDKHQNGTLLAPRPSLGNKIALGAWVTSSASDTSNGRAYLARCKGFDEKAYDAFFDAYQFQGPERFPSNTLLPGS